MQLSCMFIKKNWLRVLIYAYTIYIQLQLCYDVDLGAYLNNAT
jgi:hypothetical protein